MAKYSKKAGDKVGDVMREMKEGKLRSGRSGKKVTSRKQAIAIGLSEARKEGAKVPQKKGAAKKAAKKSTGRKSAAKKGGGRRSATKKSAPKKKSAARKRQTGRKSGSSGRSKARKR
jgi:hypothetical protein